MKKFNLLIFEVVFEFKWKQSANFVMHNRFWLLSKNLFTPPPILNPLSTKFTKWSNTLKQFVGWWMLTNGLSVFDLFDRLALKRLTDNIKLDWIPTNIKWKMQACFALYFKFWKASFVKSYKIQLPVLLSTVLQLFRTSLNIIWKRFLSQIFLF